MHQSVPASNRAPSAALRRLALLQEHPALTALSDELAAVGARLGTDAERPGDQDQAQALGHTLRNLLCAYSLVAELGLGGLPEAPVGDGGARIGDGLVSTR